MGWKKWEKKTNRAILKAVLRGRKETVVKIKRGVDDKVLEKYVELGFTVDYVFRSEQFWWIRVSW